MTANYGHCPFCGSPGVSRERRLNGYDRCEGGHTYLSAKAVDGEHRRQMGGAMTTKRKPAPRTLHAIVEPDGHVPCLSLAGNNVAEPDDRVVPYVRRDILERALRALDTVAISYDQHQDDMRDYAERERAAIRKLIGEEKKP